MNTYITYSDHRAEVDREVSRSAAKQAVTNLASAIDALSLAETILYSRTPSIYVPSNSQFKLTDLIEGLTEAQNKAKKRTEK